ncbi:MAG: aspartate aminotransferase family protein [Clostridia bacterium]|nr:aspartate aminotransferase family protein [Clostridia bacterium]
MSEIKNIDKNFVANTYARFPVQIVSGKGSLCYDETGFEYIDLGTGIGVTAFGFCDDEWNRAVSEQLGKVQHTSNLYYTEPCAVLAQKLCQRTGFSKVFFANSGAEANECAIKVARKYGSQKSENCYNIVTLVNSFHGRTLTTLSATGQDKFHELFKPLTEGFRHAVANDKKSLENAIDDTVCAVMIEGVQGEGGVIALDKEFVEFAREITAKNDILLIFDEVQTGNGRTGYLYSYEYFGVKPDLFTTAKGLGGGLPIGACVMNEKTQNMLGYGDHGSTFGGNPVCCAGAISVIDRINDQLLSEVREKSKYIFDQLSNAEGVESVSGLGLMIGIKTVKPAKEVLEICRSNGVLCLTAKDKIRLLPALNIPLQALKKAVEVIKNACK